MIENYRTFYNWPVQLDWPVLMKSDKGLIILLAGNANNLPADHISTAQYFTLWKIGEPLTDQAAMGTVLWRGSDPEEAVRRFHLYENVLDPSGSFGG